MLVLADVLAELSYPSKIGWKAQEHPQKNSFTLMMLYCARLAEEDATQRRGKALIHRLRLTDT